jgi:hypothetical protein
MRIAIIVTVAVGLFGAVSTFGEASAGAEQTARWAQARQVAQTPQAQPPTGQSDNPPSAAAPTEQSENPPSTAAPPAPPSNPSPGTPAVVLDDQEVSTILGKSVRSSAGEDMGRIVDIIVSHDGQVRAAIIDFGGFLGIGMRKIAVDWRALNFAPGGKPGGISLDLTRNQVRLAPEYKRGEPVVVVSSASPERAAPSSEAAAPER